MAWSTNKSLKKGSEIASLAELQLFRRFFSERISLSSLVVRSCHMIFVKDDTHSNIELAIKGSLKYVDAYFQLTWGFDSDEVLSTYIGLCILDAYKREGQVNSLLRKPLCLSCLCHSQSHSAEDRQAGTDQTWKRREMKKKNCCNIWPIQGLWKRLTYDFFDSKMSTKYCNHSTFVLGKLRRDVEGIQHKKSLGEVQN